MQIMQTPCFISTVEIVFYTVSQNNDTDVAHYNLNAHELILVIFGRDVADRICYRMVIWSAMGQIIKCYKWKWK